MYKLTYLLTVYARPFYKGLGVAAAVGAAAAAVASFTSYFVPVLIAVGALVAAVAVVVALLAILVLNAAVAAGLQRGFDRFEVAYDSYRRANNIPDIFYEEMDLAEAAERDAAGRA
jgi:hypothetical protein